VEYTVAGISVGGLASQLVAVGRSLYPLVKQLRDERNAANSATIQTELLDGVLDQTLGRLQNISAHDSWWRGLLQKAEAQYVRPEYLEKPAIQEWLSQVEVQDGLKVLARAQLLSGSVDEAFTKQRLADRYAAYTGEADYLALGPIEAIINILVAGALGGKIELLVAGLVQESHAQTTTQLSRLEETLRTFTGDQIVVDAHTQNAESALSLVLRRRALPLVDSQAEITGLSRLVEGDLRFCLATVRGRIYLAAARLYSQSADKLDLAREYRAKALAVDSSIDTTIVDAWLSVGAGDIAAGLTRLGTVNSPDARSNTFAILVRREGRERALAWFDANLPSDHTFFTPLGWKNAAISLSEADRWEEAAARLAALPADAIDECPDLPYVDGTINAALTLPASVRRFSLTMQITAMPIEPLQGAEAASRRKKALSSFASAKDALSDVGEQVRAALAETWRAWLLLTDPLTRQEGERIVLNAMEQGESAIDYVQLAYTFRIPFDPKPLQRHLDIRELAGGLSPIEMAAKLALYRQTRTKAEVVDFLEKGRPNLIAVMTPAGYNFLLVNALLNSDQLERAQQILDDNRHEFADDYDRIQDQIRARRGEDISRSVEDRFIATNEDVDLQLLCDALQESQDLDRLHRYNLEFFRRQRNVRNAARLCDVLSRGERHKEIVDFLNDAADLVALDDDLAAGKARSLFYLGKLNEAKVLGDRLRLSRNNAWDRSFEVNLAVAMGRWDDFADIINRAWPYRQHEDTGHLLQLAQLAANIDQHKAMELTREAVSKGSQDPEVLAAASSLAFRLGQDEEAVPWMTEACNLSSPDYGPVKPVAIQELREILTASAGRTRGVEEALSAARIPIHMASSVWKIPLTRLLVIQPAENEREKDPRRRTLIPLRNGARGITEMSGINTVAADITTLLLLADLDLLPMLRNWSAGVAIPWSSMEWLLKEVQSCRFHQPSRVKTAKKLRELVVSNTFRVIAAVEPPGRLVDEVGRELAELLHTAKLTGGRLVRPLPLHSIRSFMEREANLAEYAPFVMTTLQFLNVLDADGAVDHHSSRRARRLLEAVDQREPPGPNDPGKGPLLLDDVAVAYFAGAGLLDAIHRSNRDLRVHSSMVSRLDQLIHTEAETARALEVLSRLRLWLRDGIADGPVRVLPRIQIANPDIGLEMRALQELLTDFGEVDAVLIEDRMLGVHWRATDQSGRNIPTIDTVDLLNEFVRIGYLTSESRFHFHHRLRARGFVCLPLELEELQAHLAARDADPETGHLRESAELRSIRENVQRLRSTAVLQQPMETPYLDRLRVTGFLAIRDIWTDSAVSIPTAIARTDWVWQTIMTTPLDWAHTIVDPMMVVDPTIGFVNEVTSLLMFPVPDAERAKAFREWLEVSILTPLELSSNDLLNELTKRVRLYIRRWVDEWPQAA
jgi:hypothetical protein